MLKKKIFGILFVTLFFCCTFTTADIVENKETFEEIIEIEPSLDDPKIPMSSGDWFVAMKFGPTAGTVWPYGKGTKSHDNCVATVNLNTGVGEVYAYPYVTHESWAQVSYHSQEINTYWQWNGDNTNGKVIIKTPSYAYIEGLSGAHSKIEILVKEYNSNYEYIRRWCEDVLYVVGNRDDSLDGLYMDHELKTNYLYQIMIFAYCYQGTASYARFEPIELKQVWWAYEDEGPEYSITLNEPESGFLYLAGRKFFESPFPFALLLLCPGVSCSATTTGPVSRVVFECNGETAEDSNGENTWAAVIRGVSGIGTVEAYAYDNSGTKVASTPRGVRILKFGGS